MSLEAERTSSRARMSGRAMAVWGDRPSRVVTLSDSSEVLAVLLRAHKEGRIERVLVLESLPGGEGRTMAARLRREGVAVRTVPDSFAYRSVEAADMVLIGADSVGSDGSTLAKVGSAALALAARALDRPFYVTCDSLKVIPVSEAPLASRRRPSRLFEPVPASHVTRLLTELGVWRPVELARRLRVAR